VWVVGCGAWVVEREMGLMVQGFGSRVRDGLSVQGFGVFLSLSSTGVQGLGDEGVGFGIWWGGKQYLIIYNYMCAISSDKWGEGSGPQRVAVGIQIAGSLDAPPAASRREMTLPEEREGSGINMAVFEAHRLLYHSA